MSLKCFKFISTCRANTKQLGNLIVSLKDCLDCTIEDSDSLKNIFLTVNEETLIHRLYYDHEALPKNDKDAALKRLQVIVNPKSEIAKEEYDNEYIFEDPELLIRTKVKKRKRRNKNKIPISQMLDGEENCSLLKCKVCHKEYPTLYNLKRHYIRVHAPKDFKCTECKRNFGSLAILNQHKYESHTSVVCMDCGKTYTNRKTLALHELSHTLRLVCQTCGKIFTRKKNFRNHILTKPCGQQQRNKTRSMYICDYCNKKYACKSTLRVHIQFEHCGGQQHVCTWCRKKFCSLSKLKAHCVTHTQEKNFSCDICGGKFVTKESLVYHIRIHTGEKPFQCDFCEQRFLSSSRRAEHVRRHHMEPQLECDICHHKFKMRTCLMRHKKRHYDTTSRLHYTRVAPNDAQT